MPVFRQGRNPKELRSFYDSQKRIAKLDMQNNNQSGVMGTPMADVDSYNKLIKQFEVVENQLEAYLPSILKLIAEPDRVSAGSTAELYSALNAVKRSITRITLKALPLSDIQVLKDYNVSFNKYITDIGGFYDDIVAAQAGLPADQKQKFNRTEDDLYMIRDTLTFISQSINAQISIYDSGTAQPVKFGGNLSFNYDDPKKSAMYQTQKFLL
jgi:hypothetical protein